MENVIYGLPKQGGSLSSAYNRVTKQEIGYTTSSAKVLTKHKDKVIRSVSIGRTPIQASSLLKVAGISLDSKPYDQLYHLFMVLTFTDGKQISVEKNEVIKLSNSNLTRANTETKQISKAPNNTTLALLLEKTEEAMGYSYHRYSTLTNNCQDYILNILKANRFGSQAVKQFIKQDTSDLVGKKTSKVLDNVTRVAGIFQTLKD